MTTVRRPTPALIERAKRGEAEPGRYYDSAVPGLALIVSERGASWSVRYQLNKQRREMGIGSVTLCGLARAREIAMAHRIGIRIDRVDPLAERAAARAGKPRSITFDAAATRYIEAQRAGWRDPRAAATWTSTLAAYASPVIGSKLMCDIDVQDVLAVLTPIWQSKTETATRVRGRIEQIWDACRVQGLCTGANPALWKGNLKSLLPAKARVKPATQHHAALAVSDLPRVAKRLADASANDVGSAAALTCVLTASRPAEIAKAQWHEIDFKARIMTIPAQRMKAGREHRIPLSPPVVDLLRARQRLRHRDDAGFVFAGAKLGSHVAVSTMRAALTDAGGGKSTLHGSSRATFDNWGHEIANIPSRLIDYSLAHYPTGTTEPAYRRADLITQRAEVLTQWATFVCSGK
jgi:integrase